MRHYLYIVAFVFFLANCTAPFDKEYIKKREWLSESGSIIRFDDSAIILSGDTIFIENKACCIIRYLNKAKNEISVTILDKNVTETFLSTEELIK
jgi:hypothetical protein